MARRYHPSLIGIRALEIFTHKHRRRIGCCAVGMGPKSNCLLMWLSTHSSAPGNLVMDTASFIKERVGLFKDFSDERIKELVNGSGVRSFEANEAIAHQGAEATHFGVVLSGTAVASVVADDKRQLLGQFKAGETFGETALMSGNPR